MHAYGVIRKDQGCCPGHDKFPSARYNTKPGTNARRARIQKHRKTRARMMALQAIRQEMRNKD